MTFRHTDAASLAAMLDLVKLEKPPALVRGLEVADNLTRLRVMEPVELLTLPDDELERYFENRVTREAGYSRSPDASEPAWSQVYSVVLDDLFAEVRRALVRDVDGLIGQLRKPFDQAATKLVDHVARFGFTSQTSSDEIIDRDAATIAAFREVPGFIRAMQPYAAIRTLLSASLDLSPTVAERQSIGGRTRGGWIPNDWSVLFAVGEGWSINGAAHLDHNPQASLDWLFLAREGLTLNSVDEVRRKIAERGRADQDADLHDIEFLTPGPRYPAPTR
ncbi:MULTISPECIES: hypothetical protein [unclassified Leifsonia]|uniref:hypothetical protein n=1 Tax=unclassified Leifsonia TaxID=2663824 RepID=UPI0006F399C6|nr:MULTISPECIES: hypothetical protein [unclassified Leifsonia]KQX07333.1 hypothetical protein ASC59_06020 [Leifsonia sp. Root1293]KRA11615.1 hypothetical protein ASD61_06020 [Leifsonia sp. Root60]